MVKLDQASVAKEEVERCLIQLSQHWQFLYLQNHHVKEDYVGPLTLLDVVVGQGPAIL